MVTKARLKLIKSLARKKNRAEFSLFVVEGYKSILELVEAGLDHEEILVSEGADKLNALNPSIISVKDMKSLSNVTTPPGYLAIFKIPEKQPLPDSGPIIALDDIQDPGNLGTIIRLADWYGIKHILCSAETVDAYNPKTVQASMASIARVQIHYIDLEKFLSKTDLPLYPTAMEGTSIYQTELDQNGILIMGSESHGVKKELLDLAPAVCIPPHSQSSITESLNVAIATSIIVAEWMRPNFIGT
ncbi:RNA methyltransferase [Nonlabens spongiae]|uniref:RNA methyltransferase n=1 Tax=Nonlabens spongiae TaxID=331648 RepID=A0A1W6MJS8_9FLAO|nr:RNA methyltransferase [Nonlabens spongiae]ARN77865.1 RNA methyltransferase [Nonlabens spongiae]